MSTILLNVLDDLVAERKRQIEVEDWPPEHDDKHINGELARAAACYAIASCMPDHKDPRTNVGAFVYRLWPWSQVWWKPKDRRRDLVRAGALIIAEIERLDRNKDQGGGI